MKETYLISYWFFAWYVLYMLNITKYNPKIWIIIILVCIALISCILIYYKSYNALISIIAVNTIIKVIPLWTIRNSKILIRDVYAGLILCIIYILWIMYNKENIYLLYKNISISLLNDKPLNGQLMQLINKLKLKLNI